MNIHLSHKFNWISIQTIRVKSCGEYPCMFKPNKEIKYTTDSLVNKKVQPMHPGLVSINKIRVAAGIIKVRWYWKDMLSSHPQDLSTIIYVTLKRYLHINSKFVTITVISITVIIIMFTYMYVSLFLSTSITGASRLAQVATEPDSGRPILARWFSYQHPCPLGRAMWQDTGWLSETCCKLDLFLIF